MLKEGLPNIIARHTAIGNKTREGIKSLGLPLFADPKYVSNTVTAVKGANGLDVKKMVNIMRDKHGIVLGGGQQKLSGEIFRIGHLGWVTENDIEEVITALKEVLPQAGYKS